MVEDKLASVPGMGIYDSHNRRQWSILSLHTILESLPQAASYIFSGKGVPLEDANTYPMSRWTGFSTKGYAKHQV